MMVHFLACNSIGVPLAVVSLAKLVTLRIYSSCPQSTIIIREICKALNKHSITHIMYFEMEM